MIDETFARIEGRIQSSDLPETSRAELMELIASLRTEIGALEKKDPEKAKDRAQFADQSTLSAQEASAASAAASRGSSLESTVESFEAQHPQLVERVNRVCVILSNMGI